jgi:hypothetical protein
MLGRSWADLLRCCIWAVLVACSASPGAASDATPATDSTGSAPADAGSAASPAGCELMTCPTSTPLRAEGCSSFETLRALDLAERSVLAAAGTTGSASDTSQSEFGSCAGASSGPDVWYQLDLSNARGPVEIQAAVDAAFDVAVDLRQGPCGDTRSIACDRGAVVGGASSTVTARLQPGMYWLVVDGASDASAGRFRLQLEIDPLLGCTRRPSNQSCETAAPLEALERQTMLFDEACATEAGEEGRLYYALDLSAEAAPVLTSVSIWNLARPRYEIVSIYALDTDPDCEAPLVHAYLNGGMAQRNSAQAQLLLSPGRYVIEAAPDELLPGTQMALTVQLDREACRGGPVGNDCVDAIDIDPGAASQMFGGNTVCNANLHTLEPCAREDDDGPDQFYRLDLRGALGVTRTRLTMLVDGLNFLPLLSVSSGTASGECGEALYCDDRINRAEGPPHVNLLLEPALYFVGIEGGERGAGGSYRLLVELEAAEPSPCVNAQIDDCMFEGNQTLACCREWTPICSSMVAVCGLSPATQACVCAANPACCQSSLLAPDCGPAKQACNYLCPDFAPSELTCLGNRT